MTNHSVRFAVALVLLLVSVVAEAQPAARRQLIGRVVDNAGRSIPGAFVTVRPSQQSNGLPELEAVADDAGRFRFDGVPPGIYRLAGHQVSFQVGTSTVEVAADRDTEVSIVMVIGPVGGNCVGGFPVKIRTRSTLHLPTAALTVTGPGHRSWSEVVSPTGLSSHCFAPSAEDQVTLDVLGYGEHILKRAGVDPKKVAWDIVVEPSAASRRGRTTGASATGQVRGRVFDEQGASIPDVSVSFQPLDPHSGLTPFEAIADSRGRFDFIGVRPGTYRVTAKAVGFETTVIIQEVAAGVETDVTVVVRRREASALRNRPSYVPGSRRAVAYFLPQYG